MASPLKNHTYSTRILRIGITFLTLIFLLSGCSSHTTQVSETTDASIFIPEGTKHPEATVEADELPAEYDEPLEAPADEPLPETTMIPEATVTPAATTLADTFTYTTLTDSSFGFTFVYPSSWVNVPGKHTACFREQSSESGFPARIALTIKRMPHKPTQKQVYTEFQSYAKIIYDQYEASTFSFGNLKKDARFLGQQAYEVSYLAYADDIEVEGYLICCAVDYTIYAFHFCASYDAYQEMGPVLKRIRDSVAIVK